jgi:hypothetical protein
MVASGVGVIVGADGQLGTVISSVRFKEAIKPTDQASEAILALKPVTFRYKRELDPEGIPQFGVAPVCSARRPFRRQLIKGAGRAKTIISSRSKLSARLPRPNISDSGISDNKALNGQLFRETEQI